MDLRVEREESLIEQARKLQLRLMDVETLITSLGRTLAEKSSSDPTDYATCRKWLYEAQTAMTISSGKLNSLLSLVHSRVRSLSFATSDQSGNAMRRKSDSLESPSQESWTIPSCREPWRVKWEREMMLRYLNNGLLG